MCNNPCSLIQTCIWTSIFVLNLSGVTNQWTKITQTCVGRVQNAVQNWTAIFIFKATIRFASAAAGTHLKLQCSKLNWAQLQWSAIFPHFTNISAWWYMCMCRCTMCTMVVHVHVHNFAFCFKYLHRTAFSSCGLLHIFYRWNSPQAMLVKLLTAQYLDAFNILQQMPRSKCFSSLYDVVGLFSHLTKSPHDLKLPIRGTLDWCQNEFELAHRTAPGCKGEAGRP